MKALIFGITGQDGSYLAELLLDKGYAVTGVTRRVSVDTTLRIKHLLDDIKIAECDITDQFCVHNVVYTEQPNEIYNLAAQSHVGTSFKQPSATWAATAGGCMNILESIRYHNMMNKVKFYQASSSEMFGRNYDIYPDGTKYQNELTKFKPQSPYAIAKLSAHYLVDNYRESYGLFGSSGILFNHESERRGETFVTRKITKWIGEFVVSGKSPNFPALRLGNLNARRDWGHARDYVQAMWLMLQQDKPDDYVIATGVTHSIRDFLDEAFNCIGINDWSNFVIVDPEFYRPAEVDHLLGVAEKAKNMLGWEPKINFKQLVNKMVESDIHEAELRRSRIQEISC
jgi:GDPmannose 4,6-dehydratase